MKSLITLWKCIAEDYAIRCHTSATMDVKTVHRRSKCEGLSFLTITLPTYGKDFQKALDNGILDRNSFQGFSWRAGLPQFLGGFLDLIFDRTSGVLLDEPDIDAILAVRQLSLLFSKVLFPCNTTRTEEAMSGFVECESEVADWSVSAEDLSSFRALSNRLFRSVFSRLDKDVYDGVLVPKHGPGSTADKLRGNAKYQQRDWTDRLEQVFHVSDNLFCSPSHYVEGYDDVHFREPDAEIPVKVIPVPKTQKTPRIIAIEPTCMQYMQQAILEPLVGYIQEDEILSGLIGFDDQVPNQDLAREGSITGSLATLDLSEASDRVPWKLIETMLHDFPHLHKAVDATRSRWASVPGHGVIPLSKFASMGSALCFPFEAMAFLVMVLLGLQRESTHFSDVPTLREYVGRVRIYGDDIICPVDSVYSVIDSLEHYCAKVGSNKSFWIGRFRESCGKEYYDGYDVSIVKVRRSFPTSRKDVPEVISLVSLRNQLYKAGCWGSVKWLDLKLEKMLKHFPYVSESSSVLGRHSFLGYETQKMCRNYHAPLVKGWVVTSRLPKNKIGGQDALLKFFLKRGNLPVADRKHLERSGRPRAVDIKPRWAQPF